jgi:NaMN:DMB phosphoribosyltransferase
MAPDRVERLWQRGVRLGRSLRRPLVLAECVPGGTSTAQAALTALGLPVADLVSGSALHPPMQLKRRLVEAGLQRAALGPDPSPQAILAAVGDPFQAVAAGLLLGAMESGQPVLLAGGSQMLAVLALALRALPRADRSALTAGVTLGTTAWLAAESLAGRPALAELLARLERALSVEILALHSGLRFHDSRHQALRDYERGYVKEGVGAGALVLLAQLRGCSLELLRRDCDQALDALQRL